MSYLLQRLAGWAVLCLLAPQAWSHDSWLSPSRVAAVPGQLVLELSTGTRYPIQQFTQTAASVARSGCTSNGSEQLPLSPTREQPKWLELTAAAPSGEAPLTYCWAELSPVETELAPALVEIYFTDIQASAFQREAWAALRARGLPWHETYRKFAKIELASSATLAPGDRLAARRPAGLDLEIVVLGDRPITARAPVEFQVLRDGQPLAGFPVELVSARHPLGIWRVTDANGLLRHSVPFAGRWLLRGTDLRLSVQRQDAWESRFVTLVFEAR